MEHVARTGGGEMRKSVTDLVIKPDDKRLL